MDGCIHNSTLRTRRTSWDAGPMDPKIRLVDTLVPHAWRWKNVLVAFPLDVRQAFELGTRRLETLTVESIHCLRDSYQGREPQEPLEISLAHQRPIRTQLRLLRIKQHEKVIVFMIPRRLWDSITSCTVLTIIPQSKSSPSKSLVMISVLTPKYVLFHHHQNLTVATNMFASEPSSMGK